MKKDIIALFGNGQIAKVISELKQLNVEDKELSGQILQISARFAVLEKHRIAGTLSQNEINIEHNNINVAILSLIDNLYQFESNSPETEESSSINLHQKNSQMPKIFISYSHADNKLIATKIKNRLINEGFKVTLDLDNMAIGQDIKKFIQDSIRDNDVTLSIVSEKSLHSNWVGMESFNTFYAETYANKKFLAAFTDGVFFSRDFVDKALDKTDAEIAEIDKIIADRISKNRNTSDLNNERQRYKDLQHYLPEIVRRLKESLSADIGGDNFESGLNKIIDTIRQFSSEHISSNTGDASTKSNQNANKVYNIGHIDNANFS